VKLPKSCKEIPTARILTNHIPECWYGKLSDINIGKNLLPVHHSFVLVVYSSFFDCEIFMLRKVHNSLSMG